MAELRAQELALREGKARVEDRAAALELEVARKLDSSRTELESRVRAQEQERASLRQAEFQKNIADMSARYPDGIRQLPLVGTAKWCEAIRIFLSRNNL